MKKFLLFSVLAFLSISSFGQEVETVSDRFHYRYLKPQQNAEQILRDNEERQRNWQEELARMRADLAEGQRVSDNVNIELRTDVVDGNLVISVAYETLVVADAADDYALGKYVIESSNACTFMCNFLKSKMENELAPYLREGTNVDVKITGATDGTPIRSRIAYKGEYGDFTEVPITLNGAPFNMTVTQNTGVTTNGQLAFLRSQGVEHFLRTQVEPMQHTENSFQIFAVENQEKGGGYRRVSVEMTIHDVFSIVEPSNNEQP